MKSKLKILFSIIIFIALLILLIMTINVKSREGMRISKECNEMLEKAEKKITMLIKAENGELVEENFVQNEE